MTAGEQFSSAQKPLKIMLCALEPSGDALGAALIAALRRQRPQIEFTGCGGPLMAAQGLESLFSIKPFSVMGPADALRALPAALKAADSLANNAVDNGAQAAILIDSWAFSQVAAKRIKRRSPTTKLIKYVAPQVWASRPRRAEKATALFDGILCLFAFETRWFEGKGAQVKSVGHSGFQNARDYPGDGERFRLQHKLGEGPLLAVLPGSRRGELDRLEAPFEGAVRRIVEKKPDTRIVVVAAPSLADILPERLKGWPGAPIIVPVSDRFDAFAAADAALAASGTVVNELAIQGTPVVAAYRLGPMSAAWARRVVTTPYVSLINIAADREVIPEFLLDRCTPELLAQAVLPLLSEGPARSAQLEAFPALIGALAGEGPPAAEAAAQAVLDWMGDEILPEK